MRRIRTIAARLVLALVLPPLLLEGGLQVAALCVHKSRSPEDQSCLVLCQGDSNTFGLYLPPEQSYPAQLERLLRERGAAEVRVANRGVPGKPSWVVTEELDQDLRRFQPRAVMLLAGVNNRWAIRPSNRIHRALGGLRTVQLVRLLWEASREDPSPTEVAHGQVDFRATARATRRLGPDRKEVRFRDRADVVSPFTIRRGRPTDAEVRAGLASDWATAIEKIRAAGALPIVACYPEDRGAMMLANEVAKEVAREHGVPLVDPRPSFARAIDQVGREAVLFADGHPTAHGYSILARLIVPVLEEAGFVAAGNAQDPLEHVTGWTPPSLSTGPWCEGGSIRGVEIQYASGYEAVLLASTDRGCSHLRVAAHGLLRSADEDEPGSFVVPLAPGSALDTALLHQTHLRSTLDAEGTARIPLPQLSRDRERTRSWWGAVVILGLRKRVFEVSDPMDLTPLMTEQP